MKKIFRIGLLLLLYIATLAVVQDKASPTYTDAGIQCLTNPDQPVITVCDQPVPVIALFSTGETNSPYLVALRPEDVEKSLTTLNSNLLGCSQSFLSPLNSQNYSGYMETNRLRDETRQMNKGRYRLDIGETFSGQAVTCRHT